MKGPEDDAGLAGKVALISGGGAAGDGIGNGRAAAILLARDGVKVLVADRNLALAERTSASCFIRSGRCSNARFSAWSTDSARPSGRLSCPSGCTRKGSVGEVPMALARFPCAT